MQKAQEVGWNDKQLVIIYVSLSQTHVDNKDFKKAIHYYNLELEQYADNPAEVHLVFFSSNLRVFFSDLLGFYWVRLQLLVLPFLWDLVEV